MLSEFMHRISRRSYVIMIMVIVVLVFTSQTHVISEEVHKIENSFSKDKVNYDIEFLRENYISRRLYKLLLDVSVPEIHVDNLWSVKDNLGRSIDGSGIAVGIIDTGIDYTHPDFYFKNGSTKILAIWDQTVNGKPPKNFNYGYECTKDDIESRTCPTNDIVGHGTHVASIAAGSGRAGPYRGVAPGASLIIVKSGGPACNGTSWYMSEAEIIDGLMYIAEKARELGVRTVVNLSLGTDLGGHDGSSPLEYVIEKLVDEGIIVVVAAGNSAEDDIHAIGYIEEGKKIEVKWFIPPETSSFGFSLWLDRGDIVKLTLKTPSGISVKSPTRNLILDNLTISITENIYRDSVEWLIELYSNSSLESGVWSLEIEFLKNVGEKIWHAWIDSDTCSYLSERILPGEGYIITNNYTVSIPATSPKTISVGGYVTKNTWVNYKGEVLNTRYNIDELLEFSGRGPTRDGRVKPDITAPGSVIVAAKPTSEPSSISDINRYYTVKHGTSMASPHVAGLVALILQINPHATYENVISILKTSARWNEDWGQRPRNDWGWGKVDGRIIYWLNISFNIPSALDEIEFSIDNETITISGNKNYSTFFLKGTSHQLRVRDVIEIGEYVRYVTEKPFYEIVNDSNIEVRYFAEYYLKVLSELGGEVGSGWYRHGEIAKFTAREYVFPIGLEVLFKPIYRLSHWIDEEGRILKGNWITMDSPHTVKAIYIEDYGLVYTGWVILLTSLLISISILYRLFKTSYKSVQIKFTET